MQRTRRCSAVSKGGGRESQHAGLQPPRAAPKHTEDRRAASVDSAATQAAQPDDVKAAASKRSMSPEHRSKLAVAQRQRWERWRAERGISPPPIKQELDGSSGEPKADGRGRWPKSPETRAKMSAARKALLERLGGVPEEWRQAQSEAASQRRWSLDVRYRMSRSALGRDKSPETRQNMSAGQRRRRERERRERAGGSGGGAQGALQAQQAQQLNRNLERERAVIELSRLRAVVGRFMSEYEAQHGRKPSMQEAAEAEPDVYRAFVRYVGLRETLRRGAAPDGSGAGARGGSPSAQRRQRPP